MAPLTGFAGFGGGSSGLTVAGGAAGTGKWYGDRGIFCLGAGSSGSKYNNIEYFDFGNLGNATDFGDHLFSGRDGCTCSDGTKGIIAGGSTGNSQDSIGWFTIATTGNASDRGDLTVAQHGGAGASDGYYGLIAGGHLWPVSAGTNVIDTLVVATTGDATDFGDLTEIKWYLGGCGDATRALWMGGANSSSNVNVIEYSTYATAGNATDFGDLQSLKKDGGGCSGETRGLFGGGWKYEGGSQLITVEIDYVTIDTTGNASGFGELSVARANGVGGCASETKAAWGAGWTGSMSDVMDYVTIASTGNASDFGDLAASRHSVDGLSGA